MRPAARAASETRSISPRLSSVTRAPASTARRTSAASLAEPFTEMSPGSIPEASAAWSSPGPNVSQPSPSEFRMRRSASDRLALSDGSSVTGPSGQRSANAAAMRRALRRS